MSEEEKIKNLMQYAKYHYHIGNCNDLMRRVRGRREGIFHYTEGFRIDFENKMTEISRLQEELQKEKEENRKLRNCHLKYEEMTGIDLLLEE